MDVTTKAFKLLVEFTEHVSQITTMNFSADGKYLACANLSECYIFDLEGVESLPITSYVDHSYCYDLAWALDGNWFITAGKRLQVWSGQTGKMVADIPHGGDEIRSVAISPKGNLCAIVRDNMLYFARISVDEVNGRVEWKETQSFEYTPKQAVFFMMMTGGKKIIQLEFSSPSELVLTYTLRDISLCLQYAADTEGTFHPIRNISDFSSIPSFTLGSGTHLVAFSPDQFLVTSGTHKAHRYIPYPFLGISPDSSSFFFSNPATSEIFAIGTKSGLPTWPPAKYPSSDSPSYAWVPTFACSDKRQVYYDLNRMDFYRFLRSTGDYFICDARCAKFSPTSSGLIAVAGVKEVVLLQLLRDEL